MKTEKKYMVQNSNPEIILDDLEAVNAYAEQNASASEPVIFIEVYCYTKEAP